MILMVVDGILFASIPNMLDVVSIGSLFISDVSVWVVRMYRAVLYILPTPGSGTTFERANNI